MVEKMRVGFFEGRKGKRKMERKNGKKRNEIENKIKGDGYGDKNGWVEEKMGIMVAFT